MIYLLIGYMWLFVHRPFEIWPQLGALRVEFFYVLVTFAFWVFFARKTWTRNRVTWGIGFLVAAVILSTLFSRYTDFRSPTVQDWFKILVFYVLVMLSVREQRQLEIFIVAFVLIMGLYELHSLKEYLAGRGVYRMGTWRMIGVDLTLNDPNSFSASVNYGIPMLFPVLALAKKKWHYLACFALFALAVTCILLTGSRTGFVALVFQIALLAILSKYRWRIIPILLIASVLTWNSLPQDRQDRYMIIIDPSRGPANAQQSAEGRMEGFLDGIANWKASPLFGVGPGCHGIATGKGFQAHNLYGQVLGELGTMGTLGLLILLVAYTVNFFEARRLFRQLSLDRGGLFLFRVSTSVFWTVMLLLFSGWGGHNLFRYTWLWYAAFQAIAVRAMRDRMQEQSRAEQEIPPGDEYADGESGPIARRRALS